MIDRSLFNVEDFLVDNTFQLYCAGTDQRCVEYWEQYINAHPEQDHVIAEARRLYGILSGNKKALNQQLESIRKNISPAAAIVLPVNRKYIWLRIAAAVLVVFSVLLFYQKNSKETVKRTGTTAFFSTKGGERKKITLSDGSVVLLNSKSSLKIAADFNCNKREVHLIGEAFFDVVHREDKPFQVHTSDFDINVLGTSFNVKVYPGEATSEAVLIKGVIVMEGKGSKGSSITLKPSQKVTFFKKETGHQEIRADHKQEAVHPQIAINQYTKVNDSTIVEMAWTQNRLEILDQNFAELKNVLERWYDVDIKLTDKEIEKYRFTATFSHETMEEALKALQKVEHFKYEIKGKQITISK